MSVTAICQLSIKGYYDCAKIITFGQSVLMIQTKSALAPSLVQALCIYVFMHVCLFMCLFFYNDCAQK